MNDPRRGQRAGQRRLGCILALITLAVGMLLGALIALSLVGLDLGYLLGRVNGSAPQLVPATAVPTPLAAISGAAPGRRLVWRSPIALDSDTREPDLLVISRNYDRGGDSVVYFSPDQQAVRWESAPLGDNGNSWVVTYDAEMIYLADAARLLALGRADGELRWEAPLTDRIFYNVCRDCLQAVGGAVVALSDNGEIQAFRGSSGAPLWTVRLREATRQLVVAGGLVGAPDLRPDVSDSSAGLYLFDPLDGSLDREIVPVCQRPDNAWEDRPHYYDAIYVAPGGGALYWLLDSAGCVVRADAASGAVAPLAYLPDSFSLAASDEDLVFDGTTLYLHAGEHIIAVDAAGATREVATSADYALVPLEVRDGTLLARATRQRGSSRLELWAIDLASGARRWERVLEADDPLHGPYDTGDWAATIVGDAVALVEQRGDASAYVYELISLSDGVSRARATLPLADPDEYLRGATWGSATAFLPLGNLYAVELSSGRALYYWP